MDKPDVKYDVELIVEELRARTGLAVYGNANREGISISYGNAWVTLPRYLPLQPPGSIRCNREGVGAGIVACPAPFWPGVLDGIADVLRTGRTCEVGRGVGVREMRWDVRGSQLNVRMNDVVKYVDAKDPGERWNLNPEYQRGAVWTDRQAMHFLGHMLEGGAVAPLYVNRLENNKNLPEGFKSWLEVPAEVIDGQQRLRAVLRWLKGEVQAELSDGRLIAYADTDEIDRRGLPAFDVEFVDLSRRDVLRLYLKLNRGGTVHSDSEIERVRQLLARELGE